MKIEWNYGNQENLNGLWVRKKVFVDEQGFSQENEFDSIDEISHHLCVYTDEGEPVGAARLFLEDEHDGIADIDSSKSAEISYHCGRICIISTQRGVGLGADIMHELEKKAIELKATQLVLSAQVRVKGFYAKIGYVEEGAEYLDEFCPHVLMKKQLAELHK